jgi:Pyridoxamine 5'-phosphate oxidase
MARWNDIQREVPELAERARTVFDAHKHKTLATLRADGSPRISGIEADFWKDELWLGSMPDSRKSADLKRDPRFALHSATIDVELALGDAKLSGRAEPVSGGAYDAYVAHLHETADEIPEGAFDLFRADVNEVVVIGIGDPPDHLVIETWREGQKGLRRIERR